MSERPPISLFEQYRFVEALKEVKRLSDAGIALDCRAVIMRWANGGSAAVHCLLTEGHAGNHET